MTQAADCPEIEAIERAALADLMGAADGPLRRSLGTDAAAEATALVCCAAALPPSAIVINRTIGLGIGNDATREEVRRIVARYRDAGVARYFIHRHPQASPPALVTWLAEAGLEPARAWVKFRRGRESPPVAETSLALRLATAADAPAFGRIVAAAFDLGEAAAPWLARLIGRPGWHVYMSFARDTPAGTGAMYVRDGIAWLDWGATDPQFRRRGSQGAILRRRIEAALDLGCRILVTATGESVAGDPQHSYNNIIRTGFRPIYVRANHAPRRND
jgi:hypothetical protein